MLHYELGHTRVKRLGCLMPAFNSAAKLEPYDNENGQRPAVTAEVTRNEVTRWSRNECRHFNGRLRIHDNHAVSHESCHSVAVPSSSCATACTAQRS
nr:unnamed protein product [Haemonchus contortus]